MGATVVTDVNAQKGDLWSPLHLTAANANVKLSHLLIQRGARINILNDRQETPLDRGAGNGKADVARLLIDHGAKVNVTDSSGWTPLHTASRGGYLDVLKLLLGRGADVEARRRQSNSRGSIGERQIRGYKLPSRV
jgi:ankyrin repeat protein